MGSQWMYAAGWSTQEQIFSPATAAKFKFTHFTLLSFGESFLGGFSRDIAVCSQHPAPLFLLSLSRRLDAVNQINVKTIKASVP